MRHALIAFSITILCACNHPQTHPVGPSGPQTLTSYTAYRLSGVVKERIGSDFVPLADVAIEDFSCPLDSSPSSCNPTNFPAHLATTDQLGAYSLVGIYAGDANFIYATKTGYHLEGTPSCEGGCRAFFASGDTTLDLVMVRE